MKTRLAVYLTAIVICLAILTEPGIAQNQVIEEPFVSLATSFSVCATNGHADNNCNEGFHVSDQIDIGLVDWSFGLQRDNFGDLLCGPFSYNFLDCQGDIEFSGDLGNTAVDPSNVFKFGPGGQLARGTCQVQPHNRFNGKFFATQYAKPGFHTLTATLFACQKVDPNGGLFSPQAPTNQVVATQILTINVLPDHHAKIESIELSQAIQEFQELPDLVSDLESSAEPPVPIISGKPAVLRVYMQKVDEPSDVRLDVAGPLAQSNFITLQPQCTPEMQRRRTNGCRSVDFYFTPPQGPFPTTVTLFDTNGNTLETDSLPFESRKADKLVLKAVSICDAKDANGVWQCAPANVLAGHIGKLQKLAPTDDVEVQVSNHVVREELATFPAQNREILWFQAVVKDLDGFFGQFDISDFLPGIHSTYFGMARPNNQAAVGGITYNIPSRAAAARTSALRLGTETVDDVVAHETGHSLGGHHTNTNNPPAAGAPPGCYNLAQDQGTDWPFPGDNRIQSTARLEVGFDVAAGQLVIPDQAYDIMSYCIPRWISPFHYRQFMPALGASATAPAPQQLPNNLIEFWTVSGTIETNAVVFDPMFQISTVAPLDPGTGTHQIQVLNSSGAAVFTRFFTPSQSQSESADSDFQGPLSFNELIPVTPGATQIAVIDPTGAQIGGLPLGGAGPVVQIISPAPGATLSGVQTISWTATNPNNRTLTTKVLYSPNGGGRWVQLDQVTGSGSSIIDFDTVPGAIGSALLRLLVSDGINTGSTTSAPFTVSKKTGVAVQILSPQANAVYQKNALVMLTGSAYNVDNGVLNGSAISWNSNLDGFLGNGASLPVYSLQTGTHQITMTATDQDKNTATQTVSIRIAGPSPQMTLGVEPLASAPSSCVQVTINAAPGSVELAKIDYSLDGGATFTNVPLASNPFTFTVPGSGSFQFLARAFDVADQMAVKGARFSTSAPCQQDTTPPVTIATSTPQPNANGWNNTNVAVALSSVDSGPGASGVKQIQFSLTGAQSTAATVQGNSAALTISTEGTSLLSYSALDNAGNQEVVKTLTVKLDKTPPTISGSHSPAANANGWNNSSVTVSFACIDSLSGLAPGSPPASTVLSSEGAGQQAMGACQDLAGNVASATVNGINIDETPPVLSATLDPKPNANGWNRTDVTVNFSAADALSGVASVSSPVIIQSEGRGQLASGSASDLAGNLSSLSATVNLDKTPPEAFNEFDPVQKDVVLFGRDSLSGVAPGPITPISIDSSKRTDEPDDAKDSDDHDSTEVRIYQVFDLAGNSLVLKEEVKRSGNSISVKILSLQYNDGAVLTLPDNEQHYEWDIGRDGSLRNLEQHFSIETAKNEGRKHDQELTAKFIAEENNTIIRQESEPELRVAKPGLVLLRMATANGKLALEF